MPSLGYQRRMIKYYGDVSERVSLVSTKTTAGDHIYSAHRLIDQYQRCKRSSSPSNLVPLRPLHGATSLIGISTAQGRGLVGQTRNSKRTCEN